MSFSSETKDELCRLEPTSDCCAAAEIYGVLLYCNTFTPREIRIITGNREFSKRLTSLFRRVFSVELESSGETGGTRGRRSLVLCDRESISRVFSLFGLDASSALQHHINLAVLDEDCCRRSFMRGAFLAGGSVTDPSGRYHLELTTPYRSVGPETRALLQEMGLDPRDSRRGGNHVTYFKQAEVISEFLDAIGASRSAQEVIEARTAKGISGDVNRRVNCDSANADKTVDAAQRQLAAIRSIERGAGLASLPEQIGEAALLRIANPEASLSDMAALADPPVSKSSMSHRLRRLISIAELGDR